MFAKASGQTFTPQTLTIFSFLEDIPPDQAVLNTIDLLITIDPETDILIYEGPNGALETAWYDALVAELRVARPDVDIGLLPVGRAFDALLSNPLLTDVDLTNNDTSAALLAGLIAYTSLFETVAVTTDIDVPDTVPFDLVTALPALAKDVADLVLEDQTVPPELSGTGADDIFVLTDDVLKILGGDGTDTVQLDLMADNVVVTQGSDGALTMQVSETQSVALDSIERLEFQDCTQAFDVNGIAGQAYRLYQAVFDREPDKEGLGFWIDQLDAGNVTLNEAAGFFITSEEFARTYGVPEEVSDVAYLTLLYQNVLGRSPDEAGFAFWRDQQEQGFSRSDMLVQFSESIENKALVASAIDDGIWYL